MKKNGFLIALLLVALFIPTYIGVASYFRIQTTPVTPQTATEFQIKDNLTGAIYIEKPESELAKLFNDMNTSPNTQKVDGLIEGQAGENSFVLTTVSGSRRTDYFYYFLKDSGTGYYIDSQKGTTYKIDDALVAKFLESPYAQSLYEDAIMPTLMNGENVILPKDYSWQYITVGGNQSVPATVSKKATETATYTSKNGIAFSFSRVPDTFNVTVTPKDDASNILYTGDYASISGVDTKLNPVLNVEISAEWLANEALPFGSANYSFVLDIAAQPEFLINFSGSDANDYKKFEPGDIALLSAIGVDNPSAITCTISPALTHEGKEIIPVFYNEGKNSYAFLPVAYDTAPGHYTLTFTYDGLPYPVTMVVEEKKFNLAGEFNVPKECIDASYSDTTLAEYDEFVAKLISENNFATKYFTGEIFSTAKANYDGSGLRGYGRERPVSALGKNYLNEGHEYTMSGNKVQAVMDGKILYVGYTKFSGDIVVIDHGYGLLSWYHNLDKDSITVTAGDIVKKDDIICNKVGNSGFTNGNTLHYRLTVNTVPVCAYDFTWGSGIAFK